MNEIYLIGDTHFGEETILRYENRPFNSVAEMDETMINNWNDIIDNTDSVYIVGDFGADGREMEILSKLRGKKYLIKGNHDTKSNDFYRLVGFTEVYDKPILLENFFIISHEPIYVNINMPYANIFAHVHNSPLYKDFSSHHFCVSAERINFTPVRLSKTRGVITSCIKK